MPVAYSSVVSLLPQHLAYLDLSSLPFTGTVPTSLSAFSAITYAPCSFHLLLSIEWNIPR